MGSDMSVTRRVILSILLAGKRANAYRYGERGDSSRPVYDYTSGELAGLVESYPPKFKAISTVDGGRSDWEESA